MASEPRETFTVEIAPGAPVQCSCPISATGALRPLALLVGWYQSKPRLVQKYAALYEELGYSTAVMVPPPGSVFTFNDTRPKEIADGLLHLIGTHPKFAEASRAGAGVVIQVFSNGGCFFARHMYLHLKNKTSSADADGQAPDWLQSMRNGKVFAATVFDSCPIYLHVYLAARALTGGSRTVNSILFAMVYFLFGLFVLLCWPIRGRPGPSYFRDMEEYNLGSLLYIYSDNDYVMSEDTPALVQRRLALAQELDDQHVHELHFTDSDHVMHFREHPLEYKAAVHRLCNEDVNRHRESQNLSRWTHSS